MENKNPEPLNSEEWVALKRDLISNAIKVLKEVRYNLTPENHRELSDSHGIIYTTSEQIRWNPPNYRPAGRFKKEKINEPARPAIPQGPIEPIEPTEQ